MRQFVKHSSPLYDSVLLRNLSSGALLTGMERDLPEWIRRIRARFASDRAQRPDATLPQRIVERLAALEEAERQHSGGARRDDAERRQGPDQDRAR